MKLWLWLLRGLQQGACHLYNIYFRNELGAGEALSTIFSFMGSSASVYSSKELESFEAEPIRVLKCNFVEGEIKQHRSSCWVL